MPAFIPYAVIFLSTPLTALYSIISFINFPNRWRKYFPLYVLSVFLIVYSFNPTGGSDLVRYFSFMDDMGEMTLEEVFLAIRFERLYVTKILFWICGRYNLHHLITALSTAIVYGVTGYITCDYGESSGTLKIVPKILLLQFLAMPFLQIISNLRNISSFSLVILAVYRDVYKKKGFIKNLWLYILPCMIHQNAFVLVLFRFLLLFIRGTWIFVFTPIGIAIFPTFIQIAYRYQTLIERLPLGGSFSSVISNLYFYITASEQFSESTYRSIQDTFQRTIMYSIAIIILFYFYRRRVKDKSIQKYILYSCFLCMATLACSIFKYPNYWRFFSAFMCAGGIPLNYLVRDRTRFGCVINFGIIILVFCTNIAILYIGRTIVDYKDWILNMFIHNVYVDIIEIVVSLFKV